jgi:phosphonopyruvate decarboxylase
MHMGSLATNGVQNCDNFNHIILNNGAHDSVGGQPTVGFDIDFAGIAHSAGYRTVMSAEKKEAIVDCLIKIKKLKGPSFFEIRVNKGSRKDLGRPTVAPIDNKKFFMKFLR